MRLLTPERSTEGFAILLDEPIQTPEIRFDGTAWIPSTTWMLATDTLRARVLALLYDTKTTVFKNSPTKKTLENLFRPLVVLDPSGALVIQTTLPLPTSTKEGVAILEMTGITIQKSGISSTWNIQSYVENTPVVDFEWEDASVINDNEIREINLIDDETPTEPVLQLQTDADYNARKFATKERVREARLKAILARRAAQVETQRYFEEFNNNDNESSFSEYDISDFSEEEADAEEN